MEKELPSLQGNCGNLTGARAAVKEEGGDLVAEVHGVLHLDAEVEVELGKEEEGGAAEARKVMHLPERER